MAKDENKVNMKDVLTTLKKLVEQSEKQPAKENKKPPKFKNNQQFIEEFVRTRGFKLVPRKGKFNIVGRDGHIVKNRKREVLKFFDSEEDTRNVCKMDAYEFFQEWFENEKDKLRAEIVKKCMTHISDENEELSRVAKMVFKDEFYVKNPEESKLLRAQFITAMKYWIQGILCKMQGNPFIWPIVPVFWSKKHGTGKSSLMQKFCEPLQPFVIDVDLTKIADIDRNFKVFSEYFVITCEELAGAKGSDVHSLKKVITTATIFARIFHTQEQEAADNIASFIAASNIASANVLNDVTDNRRFFDIKIPYEITQEEIDSINVLKIFQNEKIWDKNEIARMRGEYEAFIKPAQQATRKMDYVQEFIEASNLCVNEDSYRNTVVNARKLFGNFIRFWEYQGFRKSPKRFDEFLRELCELLDVKERRTAQIWRGIEIDLDAYREEAIDEMRNFIRGGNSHLKVVSK